MLIMAALFLSYYAAASPARPEYAQAARIADVFLLGPAMITLGRKNRNAFLTIAGATTIGFNLRSYLDGAQSR
jgi:hypothetical protein